MTPRSSRTNGHLRTKRGNTTACGLWDQIRSRRRRSQVRSTSTWTGLAAWNDTRFIRLTWVDISSVIRCKVLTLKHFRTLVSKSPGGVPTTTLATASLGLVGRALVDGFSVAGDYLFEVDLSSLRLLPYVPSHAVVFGWLNISVLNLS